MPSDDGQWGPGGEQQMFCPPCLLDRNVEMEAVWIILMVLAQNRVKTTAVGTDSIVGQEPFPFPSTPASHAVDRDVYQRRDEHGLDSAGHFPQTPEGGEQFRPIHGTSCPIPTSMLSSRSANESTVHSRAAAPASRFRRMARKAVAINSR